MDISIDDLKNNESQNNNKVEAIISDIEDNLETASEYKKRLNKKISDMTDEEKKKYNALSQSKKEKKIK